MVLPGRFSSQVLTNVVLHQTAFAKDGFDKRMTAVRLKIEHIRDAWTNDDKYTQLMRQVKNVINIEHLDRADRKVLQDKVDRFLEGFQDYADTTHRQHAIVQAEQYHAVELYCSQLGYDYIYSTVSHAFRNPHVSDDVLTAAVALIELVTIDLYNLRLSNLGDDRYSNFQDVVYRCFRMSHVDIEMHRNIVQSPKVQDRHFCIPLGLCSSSTDEARALESLREMKPSEEAMIWVVHVHGMDPDLLRPYLDRHPDSVVTTICAMPVARLSPLDEKEVFLRGTFSRCLQMTDSVYNSRSIHRGELVTINANRDHTTERASDLGEGHTAQDVSTHGRSFEIRSLRIDI